MVSIIGNKGSGKSAIADIIGLCGNSHHYNDFSFLNKDRFLKGGLAKNFSSKLEFASGEKIEKNLSESVDIYSPERVRYLPQSFFERLTNNLESYDFERTLEELVFSYLPEEEKLGKNTFQDLISYKKESIKKDIELIVKEIKEINERLINLEEKADPNYLSKLENELKIKKKELEELEKNKPNEIKNPDADEGTKKKNEKITKELEGLTEKKENFEEQIEKNKTELITLKKEIEELKTIKEDLLRFESEIKETISDTSKKLAKYDIDSNKILTYKLDLSDFNKLLEKKKRKHKDVARTLFSEDDIEGFSEEEQKLVKEKSIVIKLHNVFKEINELKNKLSTPYKKYHEYTEKLKKWEKDKTVLIGNADKNGTIKWYEHQIKFVTEELPEIIKDNRSLRVDKTLLILNKKLEIVNIYNRLKESVDKEIKGHKDILKDYEINIDVALKLKSNFTDEFLSFINKGIKGSFYEIEQSNERIKKLIDNKNFQEKDILKQFLLDIIDHLDNDKREGYKNEKRQIKEQIIQNKIFDFYNYLFSINYLEPTYELKLGEKHITELSPGEKGAMLIVFYLMLDKENIPLIIDQPEENLDNESIYKILVHFIKETKKRRQVIMVTHNPNLAIVGDSEQIIYVTIDKKNKNTFSFNSGAIENPKINELSSKILEGTIKAFDIRRLKYFKV